MFIQIVIDEKRNKTIFVLVGPNSTTMATFEVKKNFAFRGKNTVFIGEGDFYNITKDELTDIITNCIKIE